MPIAGAVLILGGGQAGACTAMTLRREGYSGRVILVGEESHPPYERPPLSKGVLIGGEPQRVQISNLDDYRSSEIELRVSTKAMSLDLVDRKVLLGGGERLGFDTLVLATGSIVRRLQIPGGDLDGVVYLRTLDEALDLRSRLARQPRTVIVGGGLVGLEVAASARTLNCDVTILEMQHGLMSRVAPPQVGKFFEQAHRDRGIKIHFATEVENIEGFQKVERVVCSDGRAFAADLVVVAIGVTAQTQLAATAGLEVKNGIVVDGYGRAAGATVYAAGDVTNHPNPFLNRRVRLESWQNAQNQAIAVAKAICGNATPYAEVPWFWSDQFDFNLQMVGLPVTWDTVITRGDPRSASFSIFYLEGQRVVGVSSINCPHDIAIGRRLIEKNVIVDSASIADVQIALKKLLKRNPI
jgi:3-phenylpropionate/trans-cinnamate dioxygenase ferredoxin reductase subunit